MAVKTYRSNTGVSLSVALPSGRSLHVAFLALSNGTSYYTTDNPDIQWGLEHHARFGKLFTIAAAANAPKRKPAKPAGTEDGGAKAAGITKVPVSDWGSAKDYVAERFGVSRSALKSHAAIVAAAAKNNVEFTGLD